MFHRTLLKNRVTLVENADFSHFEDHLIAQELLTWEEIETIRAEKTRHQQIRKFLDILRPKSDSTAEQFLTIIKETDPNLYSQLDLSVSPEDTTPKYAGPDNEALVSHGVKQDNPSNITGDHGSLDHTEAIRCELRDWYSDTLSILRPIPWCEWLEVNLDHVFVNLEMWTGRKNQLCPRLNSEYVDISSLINSDPSKKTVCFIEGPAGVGKSTLCRQLVYKWSKENYSIGGHCFDLALLLEAKLLKGNLKECITEQLFPKDFDLSEDNIYKCLKKRQKKCLLIIDGIDELSPEGLTTVLELLEGDRLRHVHLLLTGRPEASRGIIKYVNKHFQLKGFSPENVTEYVCKFFGPNDNHLKDKLLSRLESDGQLKTMMINPFTTVLVCIVVKENQGDLPAKLTDIIDLVLGARCKNYVTKKEGSGITFVSEDLLLAAGHLAYNGLKQGISAYPEETLDSFCPDGFSEHLLESGLLSKDFTISRQLDTKGFCYFPHKSFQEFLCAKHLTALDLGELKERISEPFLSPDLFLNPDPGLTENVILLLLGMLKSQVKMKVVLESRCQEIDQMASEPLKVFMEILIFKLCTFVPNEGILELLAQVVSTCERIQSTLSFHSFGNQLEDCDLNTFIWYVYKSAFYRNAIPICVKGIRKMKLLPVLAVADNIGASIKIDYKQQVSLLHCRRYEQLSLRTVTEMHFPHSLGMLVARQSYLCATEFFDMSWSFVHCGSIKAANDILTKGVKVSVLTILLIRGTDSSEDATALVKSLTSANNKVAVLFLVLEEDLHDDQHFLRMLSLFSSLQTISFKKIKCVRNNQTYTSPNRLSAVSTYLPDYSSIQMYHSKCCPY